MSQHKNSTTKNNFCSAANQKWQERFDQLVKFKKKYGTLPTRELDHTLLYWLTMQRKRAKNGELSEKQLQMYEELGVNILGRKEKV